MTLRKQKILFITNVDIYPVRGGENLRSDGLISAFRRFFSVHVIIITKSEKRDSKSITYVHHKNPYGSKSIAFMNRRIVNHILEKGCDYDVLVFDYAFLGHYARLFKKKGFKILYSSHNAQAKIIKQKPVTGINNLIKRNIKYLLGFIHERLFFKKLDGFIVVSKEDANYHRRFIDNKKIFVIPNFINETNYKTLTENIDERRTGVIMSANFKAYQNAEGLLWFIDEVWDSSFYEKYELIIVGKGSERFSYLSNTCDNLKVIGEVEDMKPYIANAKISVIPLLHGSGSRLKCIESMALGTQIISTSKGAEGIEHNGLIKIADSNLDFKKALHEALKSGFNSNVSKGLQAIFLEKYSLISQSNEIKFIVDGLFENRRI